ncbi:MAG: DUF4417 domain-containing protein [Clostridia bacterium]|nr:DUF4417 domain-containing protein [Clostridia bacterium]
MKSIEFRTDPMFLRNQFKGDGVFEIPKIEKEEIKLENVELIGYDKLNENETEKIVHFFLDDYKFEAIWNDPEPRIEKLKKYKAVLAPNYSIYTEMPLSLKVYNTFRSRWCGAYLQSKGIKVIPTVAWGEPNTFWFCFDGIEKGSIVAVSTLGVRKEKALFMQGYNELIRKIKPQAVICYGEPFEEMMGKIITVDYAKTNNYVKRLAEETKNTQDILSETHYTKTSYGYVDSFNKGMGTAGNASNTPSSTSEKITQCKISDLPQNVKNSYYEYNKRGCKGTYAGQTPGTKAGSAWNNNPPILPQTDSKGNSLSYREFDVNNKLPGQFRDNERFVQSSDGKIYYTSDHYYTFQEIIE